MAEAIRALWDSLGHDLAGFTDDDLLRVSELLIERFGTTSPGFPARQRVLDEVAGRGEGKQSAANGATADAPPSPCCEPRRFVGPSGSRLRHTCDQRRGEPWVDESQVVADVAQVFALHARRDVHPACAVAYAEGSTACAGCTLRLCPGENCGHEICRYGEAWMDAEDDIRGFRL